MNEDEDKDEDGMPPPPRRARAVREAPHTQMEIDRRALAADVLGILQEQRYQRTSARRNHYASWFQNM